MPLFRYSRRAEADLLGIAAYTVRTWGEDQAARYVNNLEEFSQMLADNPDLGSKCDYIRAGLRRAEIGKHVLFYREVDGGIFISRIRHQSMLPEPHAFDDDSDDPS